VIAELSSFTLKFDNTNMKTDFLVWLPAFLRQLKDVKELDLETPIKSIDAVALLTSLKDYTYLEKLDLQISLNEESEEVIKHLVQLLNTFTQLKLLRLGFDLDSSISAKDIGWNKLPKVCKQSRLLETIDLEMQGFVLTREFVVKLKNVVQRLRHLERVRVTTKEEVSGVSGIQQSYLKNYCKRNKINCCFFI